MEGGRSKSKEAGGTTFRCVHKQKFRSVKCQSRKGIEEGGRKKQKCHLGSLALFTDVNNYLSAEL